MKTSIKTILSVLLISMLAILAACGTAETTQEEPANTPGEGAPEEQPAEQEDEKPTLLIGTDAAYPPFENIEKGEIVGFDVDILEAIMAEAGYEYDLQNTGWEALFESVKNGSVNFGISAITITEDRQQTYDFSIPYFEASQMILTPSDSDVESFQDLKDKVVGVQTGTTGDFKVQELLGDKSSDIKKYETTPLAIMGMLAGEVEAVVADNVVIQTYVKNNPGKEVKAIADNSSFDSEYYGLMFQKGNDELREDVNAALKTIIDNGTYSEIYQTWFGEEPNVEGLKSQQ